MAYDAKVIQVMIASPSDVPDERQAVREEIHNWNDLHARERKVVYMPVGWETHTAPDLSAPGQSLINDRVLIHCDLLIGIFGSRIGSPTDRAISGTIDEIDEHAGRGRPVSLFFSQIPTSLDDVDLEQVAALRAYKETVQPRGLVESYRSLSEFRDKVRRTLTIHLQSNPYLAALANPLEADAPDFVALLEQGLKESTPALSEEARRALLVAATDQHGAILLSRSYDGSSLSIGRQSLMRSKERREVSRWEAALGQLESQGLIRDSSGKGEVFEITNAGYTAADALSAMI